MDEWEDVPTDDDGEPLEPYIPVTKTCPGCEGLEELSAQVDEKSKGVKVHLVTRDEFMANRQRYEGE